MGIMHPPDPVDPAGTRGAEMSHPFEMWGDRIAAADSDAAKREQMYKDLQKKVMVEGPFIIMFQNTIQLAQRANVNDFVMGPSNDVVYYNLTTK